VLEMLCNLSQLMPNSTGSWLDRAWLDYHVAWAVSSSVGPGFADSVCFLFHLIIANDGRRGPAGLHPLPAWRSGHIDDAW